MPTCDLHIDCNHHQIHAIGQPCCAAMGCEPRGERADRQARVDAEAAFRRSARTAGMMRRGPR